MSNWTVAGGILLLASLAPAADKPADLSGTWVLDKTEQSFSPVGGGPGEGSGYPGIGGGMPGGGGYPGGNPGGFPGGGGYPGGGYPGAGGGYPGGGGRRGGGGYPGRGGPGGQAPGAGIPAEPGDLTLTITQSVAEIRIERKWTQDGKEQSVVQTFALDGSENRNPDDMGRGELDSKSKWHKGTLVTEGTQEMSGSNVGMRVKREFSLSKEGKSMTVKTTRQTPRGLISLKQTFRKS